MSELPVTGEPTANANLPEELLSKLRAIDRELREETGGMALFGLFERDDTPGQWDLLVAADWVGPDVAPAVAYVARKTQEKLTPDELMLLSGIVGLRSSDLFVKGVLSAIEVSGQTTIANCVFNGILITHAAVFTADLNNHSDFKPPAYVTVQQADARSRRNKAHRAGTVQYATEKQHRKR